MVWCESREAADGFDHGSVRGPRFLRVNLMRDRFSLRNQETSEWDAWRSISEASKVLDDQALAEGDRIAWAIRSAGHGPPPLED